MFKAPDAQHAAVIDGGIRARRLGPKLVRNHVVLANGSGIDAATHAFKFVHAASITPKGRFVKSANSRMPWRRSRKLLL